MRRVDGVLAFVESGKPGNFFVSDEVCCQYREVYLLSSLLRGTICLVRLMRRLQQTILVILKLPEEFM